jgi:hypothetical protein
VATLPDGGAPEGGFGPLLPCSKSTPAKEAGMARTIRTGRYTIRRYDGGEFYFIRQDGDEYGLLLTEQSAKSFDKVFDVYCNSRLLDQAVHDFYGHAAAQLGEAGMVRPLQ